MRTGAGSVRFVSGATTAAEIARAATEAGYPTREIKPGGGGSSPGGGGHPIAHAQQHQHDHGDGGDLTRATWLAFLLTTPVFAIEMGSTFFRWSTYSSCEHIGMQASHIAEFVLTALILFGPGLALFQNRSVQALWHGAPDMNALVALGSGAAFVYSTLVTLVPQTCFRPERSHVYFKSAAVIVTLILIGRSLEARAKGRNPARPSNI